MKKMRTIYKIIICICIVLFLGFQYFGYSSEILNNQSSEEVKQKYHLNLTDIEWRVKKNSKNTLINPKPTFYYITNPYLIFNEYSVSIYVSEGDDIFETVIPKMLFQNQRDKVMLEKQVTHNDLNMTIQVLETEPDDFAIEYSACYRVIVDYNDCLYHFIFDKSPSMSYSLYSTELDQDEIAKCLSIIDELFLYNE